MDYKEFCENAEIEFNLSIKVNGRLVIASGGTSSEDVEAELGRVERHKFIANELEKQYEELPEPDYYTEADYEKAETIRDAMREDGIAL